MGTGLDGILNNFHTMAGNNWRIDKEELGNLPKKDLLALQKLGATKDNRITLDEYLKYQQRTQPNLKITSNNLKAAKDIDALINDPDSGVRRDAAYGLGKLGDSTAIGPLIEALQNDADQFVRNAAAYSLAILHDKNSVPPLIKALNNERFEIRLVVARTLGMIGDKSAVPALIEALKDENYLVREYVGKALNEIKSKLQPNDPVCQEIENALKSSA